MRKKFCFFYPMAAVAEDEPKKVKLNEFSFFLVF